MLYTQVEKRSWIAPMLLGLSAVVLCATSAALKLPLGGVAAQVLLFLSPLAFGIRGALLVLAIGVLPWSVNTGDTETGVRLAIIISSIALVQQIVPIVPGYVTTLLVWLACVSPALSMLKEFAATQPLPTSDPVIVTLLQDVLVTSLAGCLLFNEALWWRLTGRVRYLNANQLIPHLMAATSLTALFVVALALRQAGLLNAAVQTQVGMTLGTLIVAAFVLIPTLFGIHIVRSIAASHTTAFASSTHTPIDAPAREGQIRKSAPEDAWKIVGGKNTSGPPAPEEKASLELGVCALDGNGSVLFMNDNFQRLVGIPERVPLGSSFESCCTTSSLGQYIWQLVSTTAPSVEHSENLRVAGRHDNVKFLQIQLCPHQLAENTEEGAKSERPPRVIKVADITAKRTIDERLLRIQRHKALSACARSAAPQLSKLFTAMLGRASFATRPGASQAEALRHIQALCAKGGALVQQLSELSLPPENAERHTLNVATALEERLPLLRGLVPPGINVHCAASADALPVKLDPAMLTQVLSLVILNASEAYPDGNGKVSLAFGEEEIDDVVSKLHAGSRPGRFARISISDYGRGMPAEVLARAANPLLTVRGEFGHIGLDLPSVLAVMSDHDGFMTVESRPERGTTVSLYFPLSTQPIVAEDPHQLSLNNEPPPANTRVMIVEDSPELREMLSEMIKCLGYNPIACDNKESAMELLEAGNVDILVVEESLPGLAAHDLVSQAHAPGSHVKTVLLASGQNSPCEDSDTVLLKPFDISQLAKALDDSEQKTLAQ